MPSAHGEREIAYHLLQVISFQELDTSKVRVFIEDNISVNDTTIKTACTRLQPDEDWQQRQGYCAAYIINLTAKAFLFSNNIEVFEVAVEGEGSTTVDSLQLKITQVE